MKTDYTGRFLSESCRLVQDNRKPDVISLRSIRSENRVRADGTHRYRRTVITGKPADSTKGDCRYDNKAESGTKRKDSSLQQQSCRAFLF